MPELLPEVDLLQPEVRRQVAYVRTACLLKLAACAGAVDLLPYPTAARLNEVRDVAQTATNLLAGGRSAVTDVELTAVVWTFELMRNATPHVDDIRSNNIYTYLDHCLPFPYVVDLKRCVFALINETFSADESKRRRDVSDAALDDIRGGLSSLQFSTLRGFMLTQGAACRDGLIVRMARTIYDAQTFDDMPVLGDLLEEAGCPSSAALLHCRGSGTHANGCWVLDHILGWR